MAVADAGRLNVSRDRWYNNPLVRSILLQVLLVAAVLGSVYWFTNNTITNLHERGIASGFGFLSQRAGFDMVTFLNVTAESTYGYMLLAGLVDTIVVSVLAIVIATIMGLIVGIARLSSNWLIRTIATVYVEMLRNIPPLLVILFFYLAVLATLPDVKNAIQVGPDFSLSNRGLFMPAPVFGPNFHFVLIAFVVSLIIAWARAALGLYAAHGDRAGLPVGLGRAWHRRGHHRRRLRRDRRSADLRRAGQDPLQHQWRLGPGARVHLAVRGARRLHRLVHRRDRALRHHGGEPRADRGGAGARACAAAMCCASSCCRRRCG